MSRIGITTLAFILFELFPLVVSDAILCPLHCLKTLLDIIMILHSYVELVLKMFTKMTTLTSIISELFPLDGFRCNFMSAP